MSTQHTHRQAKLNRRQVAEQYAAQHALALSGRNLEDELAMAEHKIAQLEAKLAATLADLAAEKAARIDECARRIEAEAKAMQQERRAQVDHALMMKAVHGFNNVRAAHDKLSQVVRITLTPAEYHEAREKIA